MDSFAIPRRFTQRVKIHAVKFAARRKRPDLQAPQMFIIAGPPGAGKTTMAKATLDAIGIPVETISASVLGGEYEGQSLGPLRDAYLQAAEHNGVFLSALLVDDFDLSAARNDDMVSATVNANLLNSFIMNLADNPFELRVSHAGRPTSVHNVQRPPMIIMTANDRSKIFEPLQRPGRATIFEWVPNPAEIAEMVAGLYPACAAGQISRLVAAFPGQSIAFFEQLGFFASEERIERYLEGHPTKKIAALDFATVADQLVKINKTATYKDLMAAGKALAISATPKSYLSTAPKGKSVIPNSFGKEGRKSNGTHAN